MLAMMRPASATVLPRSMCGTVGVFLYEGTCTLMRWLLKLPSPTTIWLSWPRGASCIFTATPSLIFTSLLPRLIGPSGRFSSAWRMILMLS